jgi:ABC-2 type transport system permease protein
MAVYKQTYRGYDGVRTPGWSRWLITSRYALQPVISSRLVPFCVAGCLFFPVFCIVWVYILHNPTLMAMAPRMATNTLTAGQGFYVFCNVQGTMAYLLTALVAPGLVSPDLVNGGMPLFLSRPFSRLEYVAGKLMVLAGVLSVVTWIPALLVFAVQSSIEPWQWTHDNFWIVGAILEAFGTWILILSLIGLSLSAWVRWKLLAGASVLGVLFVGAGLGNFINSVMRTTNGAWFDLLGVIRTIWLDLFQTTGFADRAGNIPVPLLSSSDAWTVLAVVAGICVVMLAMRIRPFEVVR